MNDTINNSVNNSSNNLDPKCGNDDDVDAEGCASSSDDSDGYTPDSPTECTNDIYPLHLFAGDLIKVHNNSDYVLAQDRNNLLLS